MLVQNRPQNRVELVGCGVCEVAKVCLKVFIEGSSVDGAEVADYSVYMCRWSHVDIELRDDTHVIGFQGFRHFSRSVNSIVGSLNHLIHSVSMPVHGLIDKLM